MSESKDIKSILAQLVGQYKLEEHLEAERIKKVWFEVVGKYVSTYTEQLSIKNKVLYVRLKSPALRTDMQYIKTALLEKLNDQIGHQYLVDIKFV